jgi:hypothetical protein
VDPFDQDTNAGGPASPAEDVVEVPLMLTLGQAEGLEKLAWQLGLTPAQLVRLAIRSFLAAPTPAVRWLPQGGRP